MRPTATHFLFTITTLKLVASMESNPGGCASSQEVSSSGGELRPLSNDEKLTLQEFPLSKYCKPSENWPGKTPEDPLTSSSYKHLGSSHGNPQSTDLTKEGSEKSKTTERFQSPTGQTSPFGESRAIRPPFADPSKPQSYPPSGKSIPPPPGSPPTGPLPHPPQSGPPPTGPLPPLPGSKNPVPLDNTAPPPIPRRSSRRLPKNLRVPALQVSAPQIQEKRGHYEPVGTDYASNTDELQAPDAAAAIDEDPSDTDSAIVQSTEGRSPTGKEIRLTRAFNRRRILDWDLD
ncbi:hypothetical protein C8R42DRAFT_176647 [Lentinula raphanica]|nr:hypothetical protein C8R42DRAFT_176647 [Lentinula raphanica]